MDFQLPKLDALVLKDLKANEEDVRKYIHVIKGHAVVQNNLICIVNLREYVKSECDITEESDLEKLDSILKWFEGKSFTVEFWAELTKKHFVSLTEAGLLIENLTYTKILMHEEVPVSLLNLVDVLLSNLNRQPILVQRISIPNDLKVKLNSVFKNETKGLHMIYEFTGEDTSVKFQVHRKDYIFGLIPVDYDSANEIYNFQSMNLFHKELTSSILD